MSQRRRRRRPPKGVYWLTEWPNMEPDIAYQRQGVDTPIKYVRHYINAYLTGEIYRHEIEMKRRAMLKAGGLALYGFYRLLCVFVGDTGHFMRGHVVDHQGLPASPELIAETVGMGIITPEEVARDVRVLARPEIGLLAKVDFQAAWDDAKAARDVLLHIRAAARDEKRKPSRPKRDESNIDQTAGKAATNEVDTTCRSRAGPAPPVRDVASHGNTNTNGNPNDLTQTPTANGDCARAGSVGAVNKRTRRKTGKGTPMTSKRKRNSKSGGGGPHDGQPASDGPSEGVSADEPTAPSAGVPAGPLHDEPASDGSSEGVDATSRSPSALACTPYGEQPHPLSELSFNSCVAGEAVINTADQKTARKIYGHERSRGLMYGACIAGMLRVPNSFTRDQAKSEARVFQSLFRKGLERFRNGYKQAGAKVEEFIPFSKPEAWVEWVLRWADASIGSAKHLAYDPRYPRFEERARLWVSRMKKGTTDAALKHLPPAENTGWEEKSE